MALHRHALSIPIDKKWFRKSYLGAILLNISATSFFFEAPAVLYVTEGLEEVDVESCGKARVLLNGLAEGLHQNNLVHVYEKMFGETPQGSEEYFEDGSN